MYKICKIRSSNSNHKKNSSDNKLFHWCALNCEKLINFILIKQNYGFVPKKYYGQFGYFFPFKIIVTIFGIK